jgi:hypothetical protein
MTFRRPKQLLWRGMDRRSLIFSVYGYEPSFTVVIDIEPPSKPSTGKLT